MNVEQQLNTLRFHGMERQWKAMKETRQIGKLALEEGLTLLLQAESDSWIFRIDLCQSFKSVRASYYGSKCAI